jgi:predicted metal-dependent enzyme (double-stranded beta helix superfamily)
MSMPGAMTRRQMVTGVAAALATRAALAQSPPLQAPAAGGPARRFEVERFVEDCRRAAAAPDARGAVLEVMSRSISDPAAVLRGLGEPQTGGINTLYRSEQLTVLNIVWSPLMQLMPHEHRMWSVLGIYTGREDNIFWRRQGGSVRAVQARALAAGEPAALDADVIHSVVNPIAKLTGAIHVYGGDFFARPRSEWDPETLSERPWDIQQAVRIFKESNERFAAWRSGRSCA